MKQTFKAIFDPASIAIVGASGNLQKPGGQYLCNLVSGGFPGRLYPVNPKGGELLGIKVYPDLKLIPESVDYVICCLSKELALNILDDCAANGAKVVQFFTAGFRETGEEEGLELEAKLVEKAREKGLRILGPNCAGVAYPGHFRAFGPAPFTIKAEVGDVAFISHSSGMIGNVLETGSSRGIRFSKLAAFNNCCDLNELDFLEYMSTDPESKVIGAYLEGTKNGRQLLQLMKGITKAKPLVVWKGGQTEAGAQTAASHTASLVGSANMWKTAIRQAGAIFTAGFEELLDSLLAFQYLSSFPGDRIAIIAGFFGPAGGTSVTSADECVSEGLKVPSFTMQTRDRLREMLGITGTILRNPLDMGAAFGKDRSLDVLCQILEMIDDDPQVDVIMFNMWTAWLHGIFSPSEMDDLLNRLKDFRRSHAKPVIVIARPGMQEEQRGEDEKKLAEAGIPTYPSVARAARALANVRQYFERLKGGLK